MSSPKQIDQKVYLLVFILTTIFLTGCFNITKHVRKLDPEGRTFYFDVQPIMTKQERDIYFSLTKKERVEFEKEFWKIRDLSDHTEENEFKTIYYERIAIAKKAFWTDGMGLLGDRSRVYLLLGPPDNSQDYPVIQSSRFRALQKWIYNRKGLVIHFADRYGIGKYELYNPPPQLLVYLDNSQNSIFAIDKDKKWINFKIKRNKENLTVKVETDAIEYKEEAGDMKYSITVKITAPGQVVYQKVYDGAFHNKDLGQIQNVLEFKIPYSKMSNKYSYFYFTVVDNIGNNIGSRIIKKKTLNK